MFLTGDLKYNFYTYRLATFLGILPYEFDHKEFRLRLRKKTHWQWTAHILIKLFIWSRYLIGAGIFARSLTRPPKRAHYPFTSTMGYVTLGLMIWGDVICSVWNPELLVLIFNEVMRDIPKGEGRFWRTFKRKKVENMTAYVPLLFCGIGAFIIAPAYFIDSSSPLFTISIVQEWWDTGEMLILLFSIDMAYFSLILVCMINSIFIVMIFIHHVNLDIDRQLVQLSRLKMKSTLLSRVRILRAVADRMANLRIKIQYFNLGFSYVVFSTKLLTLLCACGGLFAAIHFRNRFHLLPVAGGYISLFALLFYPLVYDQAFSVPEKMGRIKYQFRRESNGLVFGYKKKEFRTTSETLWVRGIQVGGFQTFERASTLNFFDFVARQVATLLVGFG